MNSPAVSSVASSRPDTPATPLSAASPTRLLSANPSRRAAEIFVLGYSPVWMLAIAVVVLTRAPTGWSDIGHLVLGAGLALPLYVIPLLRPFAADRDTPWLERHITRYGIAIALCTLVQTYFGSALFFDRLGMEYHFHVTWILNRTPVFLYFLTLAYFSTYYVLLSLGVRYLRTRFAPSRAALWLVTALLCYAVAFGETFFMASDRIRDLFSYRDRQFTLIYGSLCYGTLFLTTLPVFARLDEDSREPARSTSGARRPWPLLRDTLALNMLALMAYEVCANWIALKR